MRCDTPKLAVLAESSLHNQIEHQKMMLYRQSEAQLQAAILMTPALIELGMAGALASWGGRATFVVVATPIAEQGGVAIANIATGRPHETPIAWGTAQALSAAGVDLDTAWFIGRGVDGGVTMAPLIVAAGMEVRGAFAPLSRVPSRPLSAAEAAYARRTYLKVVFGHPDDIDAVINTAAERNAATGARVAAESPSTVVTGRNRGAFGGIMLIGETRSGVNRVSREWRSLHGPAAMRQHHLVSQELLKNPIFMRRMRALGYTDSEIVTFVNRQIAEIPNVQHMQIHAEGWNKVWNTWLQRNPNFTMADLRAQIQSMIHEFELPRSSLGGPQYRR